MSFLADTPDNEFATFEQEGLPLAIRPAEDLESPPNRYEDGFGEWRCTTLAVMRFAFADIPPSVIVGVPRQTEDLMAYLSTDIPGAPTVIRAQGSPRDPDSIELNNHGKERIACLPERVVVIGPDYEGGDEATEAVISSVVHAWHLGVEMKKASDRRYAREGAELKRSLGLQPRANPEEPQLWVGKVTTWISRVDGIESKWHEPQATAWPYMRMA